MKGSLLIIKNSTNKEINSAIYIQQKFEDLPETVQNKIEDTSWFSRAVGVGEEWTRKVSSLVKEETHDPITPVPSYFRQALNDIYKVAEEEEGLSLGDFFDRQDASVLGEEEGYYLVLQQYYRPGASSSGSGTSAGLDKLDDVVDVLEDLGIDFYDENSAATHFKASEKTKQIHWGIGLSKTPSVSGNGSSETVLEFLQDGEVQDAIREVVDLGGKYAEAQARLAALKDSKSNKK